jgi:hypothetical protein
MIRVDEPTCVIKLVFGAMTEDESRAFQTQRYEGGLMSHAP